MKKSLPLLILSFLCCCNAYAENLCPATSSSSVERWPVSEQSISKENAALAVDELKTLISESENEEVYFVKKYANTLECQVESVLTTIRLYSLRVDALKNKESKHSKTYIDRFCKALKLSTLCH